MPLVPKLLDAASMVKLLCKEGDMVDVVLVKNSDIMAVEASFCCCVCCWESLLLLLLVLYGEYLDVTV